jgi:type IV pilus biogenesis protein CpaD/CtpE
MVMVSNMLHNKIFPARQMLLAIVIALPLSGCVMDHWAMQDELQPYGGSKQHPIKVSGNKAFVDDCGQWPENTADSYNNTMAANHGCAVQANIAAMAAYPKDLVVPRKRTMIPAYTRVKTIEAKN